MDEKLLAELLECCRSDNQITWADADTDNRVLRHIKNGVTFINDKCGVVDEDFKDGGKANALFLAYVRRALSGDLSTFKTDYLQDIIDLQIEFEVENSGVTE